MLTVYNPLKLCIIFRNGNIFTWFFEGLENISCVSITVSAFHERLSIRVCTSCPFGFESGMWNLIILVPDHSFCFYIAKTKDQL